MNTPQAAMPSQARYELRYTDLYNSGRGFAFPCDAEGHVDVEGLSARGLVNYQSARTLVGKELSLPRILPVAT